MKISWISVIVLLLGAALSAESDAHGRYRYRSHVHVGVAVSAPVFWYPPPYYYWPAPVYYYPARPVSPPVYVENGAPSSAPAPAYWHYCPDSNAYYPYVKQCAGPWQRVSPIPPPPVRSEDHDARTK